MLLRYPQALGSNLSLLSMLQPWPLGLLKVHRDLGLGVFVAFFSYILWHSSDLWPVHSWLFSRASLLRTVQLCQWLRGYDLSYGLGCFPLLVVNLSTPRTPLSHRLFPYSFANVSVAHFWAPTPFAVNKTYWWCLIHCHIISSIYLSSSISPLLLLLFFLIIWSFTHAVLWP